MRARLLQLPGTGIIVAPVPTTTHDKHAVLKGAAMNKPVEVYEEKRRRQRTKIVPCPTCGREFSVTYDPESPYLEEFHAPELARLDLRGQCPKHDPRRSLLSDRALIKSVQMVLRARLAARLIRWR
jgi:hypothetical protein